ncbi:hypothetical protein EHS25_006678 [Saitozyma podzolica]|uniref:Uncharacterized protein n=1 Tax=Saitozyma podzolica TaxID=1890683 RepID=A0A427YSC0_9TREE|nr:hypothetical protein EHS25_006678 [Saitozyma podzolica]
MPSATPDAEIEIRDWTKEGRASSYGDGFDETGQQQNGSAHPVPLAPSSPLPPGPPSPLGFPLESNPGPILRRLCPEDSLLSLSNPC